MTVGLPLTIPNSFARAARWFGDSEAVVDLGDAALPMPSLMLDRDKPRPCFNRLARNLACRWHSFARPAPSTSWPGLARYGWARCR